MATAPPYTNGLERKQGCSLQKPVDSWLWPSPLMIHPCSRSVQLWGETTPWSCGQQGLCSTAPAPAAAHSCGLAPLPLPPQCQQRPSRSQPFQQPMLRWNGLQLTAKPSLTLIYMRKRSGNVSFGSPVGHRHFSISQQVSPTCLPILSNPVKLITKHNRDQNLHCQYLAGVVNYSSNPTAMAAQRLAQKAACSY